MPKIYLQTWRTLEVYELKECYTVPSFSLFSCCSISDISLFPFLLFRYPVSLITHQPTNQLIDINRIKYCRILYIMLHLHQSRVHSRTRKIIKVFFCFTPKKRSELTFFFPRILLAYSTHASLLPFRNFSKDLYKLNSIPGGPPVFYRTNVFPQRKAIYLVNVCVINSLLSSFPPSAFVFLC